MPVSQLYIGSQLATVEGCGAGGSASCVERSEEHSLSCYLLIALEESWRRLRTIATPPRPWTRRTSRRVMVSNLSLAYNQASFAHTVVQGTTLVWSPRASLMTLTSIRVRLHSRTTPRTRKSVLPLRTQTTRAYPCRHSAHGSSVSFSPSSCPVSTSSSSSATRPSPLAM